MGSSPRWRGGEGLRATRAQGNEPPLDRRRGDVRDGDADGIELSLRQGRARRHEPAALQRLALPGGRPLPVRHAGADAPADSTAAARLGADDPAVAGRRQPVPGLLGSRHGAKRALARLDRHDHDDGLLGHPGLARRTPAAGAGLERHRHRLRRRRAGGQQLADGVHALVRQPRRHADLDAVGLRLGALCRSLRTLQPPPWRAPGDGLDDPDRLAGAAADRARLRLARRSSPGSTTVCWASGSTPRSSPWALPSSASPPASTGSG